MDDNLKRVDHSPQILEKTRGEDTEEYVGSEEGGEEVLCALRDGFDGIGKVLIIYWVNLVVEGDLAFHLSCFERCDVPGLLIKHSFLDFELNRVKVASRNHLWFRKVDLDLELICLNFSRTLLQLKIPLPRFVFIIILIDTDNLPSDFYFDILVIEVGLCLFARLEKDQKLVGSFIFASPLPAIAQKANLCAEIQVENALAIRPINRDLNDLFAVRQTDTLFLL